MSGGVLLIALLCVALGLMLSFVARKTMLIGLAALAAAGVAAAALPGGAAIGLPNAVIACATSAALTALCIHLPERAGRAAAVPLSANAGFWCGLLAGQMLPWQMPLLALPIAVALAGRWLIARGWPIVLKVLSGWLIAIAILAAALPLITTPGYVPDHME